MQLRSLVSSRAEGRLITPVFLLVTAATGAYFFALGVITPLLPRYVEGPLDQGNVQVGLAIGAFALTAVLLRPFVGRLSDRQGRRPLVVFGGILVGISIASYNISTSLPLLILFRILSGIGEAAFYVGVASVVNDIAPDDRRGEALSYFSLALFGGLAVGPIVGEAVHSAVGFGAAWVLAGASALVAGLLGLLIPETRPEGARDARQKILNRAAVIPGSLLATNIWGLATFSSFIPLFALQIGLHGSGLVFAENSAVILLIRLFGARLPDQLGPRLAGRAALSCVGIGLTTIGVWPSPVGMFVGTAIYSVGHALCFPALMTLAIRRAPAAERGSVVGTFTAFFDGSFGVGAVSAGAIAAALGYRGAFVVAGIVAFGGLGLMFTYAYRATRAARAEEGHKAE
ncbi:MAG: MFS transporter, partial [Actinomycetota bacterium]|nr:MFS transporter [Actinomycetota bacterium]